MIRPVAKVVLLIVAAYLTALAAVAAFVVHPPLLGWIGLGVAAGVGLTIAALVIVLYPHTRANAVREHPRVGDEPKLLVVADADVADAQIVAAVKKTLRGRHGDVLVVAPLLPSLLHFLTEDEGEETIDARARLAETLAALGHHGVFARGRVSTDDPLQAVGDALAAFAATEILFVVSERARQTWLEQGVARRARDLFGVHATTVTAPTPRQLVR